MSNATFRFTMGEPYRESMHRAAAQTPPRGDGSRFRRALDPRSRFIVTGGVCTFPANPSGLTYADLDTFFEARDGMVDTFLYPPKYPEYLIQVDSFTAAASQTAFLLTRKNILVDLDSAPNANWTSLVITVDGTPQAPTSVAGNFTAPQVNMASMTGGEAVVITYKVVHRCQFDIEALDPTLLAPGGTLAVPGSKKILLALSEEVPGESFV